MPPVAADLSIEARWILPMTGPAEALEQHSLIVRDGRIVDLLPRARAARAYAPTMVLSRPAHVLMPGLLNACVEAGAGRERAADEALALIAALLRSGTTCASIRGGFAREIAGAAADQGLRAIVGLPLSGARAAPQDMSLALAIRDEYQGHPLIGTAFAPRDINGTADSAFTRIAMLAAELDARVVVDLHASAAEIDESLRLHGCRPLQRLDALGLLTPLLNAAHMCRLGPDDLALAERTGIAVTLCPLADLEREQALAPAAELVRRIRTGIGSGDARHQTQDPWTGMRLAAAMLGAQAPAARARAALELATRGAAAALGLDAEIGTLEPGKWADLCCVDLGGPAAQLDDDPAVQLVFGGGREMVTDAWVAGRHLLSEGALTRLDWPQLAARFARAAEGAQA